MATIDDCKKLLEYRAGKSGFSGNISPNDFNLIWNRASQRYFNDLYKNYGINQKNTESLSVYKSDAIPIVLDSSGKYTKPTGLLRIDAVRSVFNSVEVEVKRVEDDRLGNHLSSSYDAPIEEFPIYTEYSNYIQFYPVGISPVLVYLKKPVEAKWNYTVSGGVAVYNPTGSVDPVWNDTDIDEIIYLVGVDLGINTKSVMDIQFNDIKAKENA